MVSLPVGRSVLGTGSGKPVGGRARLRPLSKAPASQTGSEAESHSETPAVWVSRPGASWRVQTPGASVPERLPEPAAVGRAGPAWPVELGFQGQHVLPLLLHVPWMLGPPLSTKDTHAPPRSLWTGWVSHTRQGSLASPASSRPGALCLHQALRKVQRAWNQPMAHSAAPRQ